MKLFINRDGIVAPWYQWIIIGMSFWTIVGYSIFNITAFIHTLMSHEHFIYNLDPRLLILIIPTGIIFGESGYREDFRVNGTKKTSTDD